MKLGTIKKIFVYFMFGLVGLFCMSTSVYAETKMQCTYQGKTDHYASQEYKVVITLDSDGQKATIKANTYLTQDFANIDGCRAGDLITSCSDSKDLFTTSDNGNGTLINVVELKNGNYSRIDDDDITEYFVDSTTNKYTCPSSLSVLSHATNTPLELSLFIIKDANFDPSYCTTIGIHSVIDGYECGSKYDIALTSRNIESTYDNASIVNQKSECCVYMNNSGSPVYVYSFLRGTVKHYAACVGFNCITLNPSNKQLEIDNANFSKYHNTDNCSNMPTKIYFTLPGLEDYVKERTLDPSISCRVPTTPGNPNTQYSEVSFYPMRDWENNTPNGGNGSGNGYDTNLNLGGNAGGDDCEGVLGPDLLDDISLILTWIRILVPILLIVLGSVDFGQAVLQDDRDSMKKATNKFIKRAVIAVAIFFIPSVIMYLLSFIDKIADVSCDIRLW